MDAPRPPIVRLICLIAFMLLGAFMGVLVLGLPLLQAKSGYDHGRGESAQCDLIAAIAGALPGLGLELALRQFEKPKLQFSVRELLVAMALIGLILGMLWTPIIRP